MTKKMQKRGQWLQCDPDSICLYFRGAVQTCTEEVWSKLSAKCKKFIGNQFKKTQDEISMDLDAYSYVISTENIDDMESIEKFLLSFGGAAHTRPDFPHTPIASKKSGVFGLSEHLPPILRDKEMLVTEKPFKIALHSSCKGQLVKELGDRGYYYSPASDNTRLCFAPDAKAGSPPYAALVKAVVKACKVPVEGSQTGKSLYIIHVADIGMRYKLENYMTAKEVIGKFDQLRQEGINVNMLQTDIAFVFKVPKDRLILASCKRGIQHDRESVLVGSNVKIHPIHEIPFSDKAAVKDNDLAGTIEIKKRNWAGGGRDVRFGDGGAEDVIEVYKVQPHQLNHSYDFPCIKSSAVYSIKGYGTLIHFFLQRRKKFPMTVHDMWGLGARSIESLQILAKNTSKAMEEGFELVNSHGFGFRIEASIRPNIHDPFRENGHMNDMLLLVCLAIKEFCSSKYTPKIRSISTRAVQTRAMKMVSEIFLMLKWRKQNVFREIYSDALVDWLRFQFSMLLITIGICPSYGLKFVKAWLQDTDRADPYCRMTRYESKQTHERNQHLQDILRKKIDRSLKGHLEGLKFSQRGIERLLGYVGQSLHEKDAKRCFISLSLKDKHLLASTLERYIIPHVSELFSQGREKLGSYNNSSNTDPNHDNDEDYQDCIDYLEKVVNPVPDQSHPIGLAMLSLARIGALWNHNQPGFNRILFSFILQCHNSDRLGHKEIPQTRELELIRKYSEETTTISRDAFRFITNFLIPSSSTRKNLPVSAYQNLLCKKYKFPS